MSNAFIGQVVLFAGNFAPRNWAFCNGQIMSINQNTALFSILGTTYGGNGQTTFALPDLRGRVPVSAGQGPGLSNYVLGEMIGTENVTLTINQMPTHTHFVNANAATGNAGSPSGAIWAEGAGRPPPSTYTTGAPGSPVTMSSSALQPVGGNQPHPVLQPLLALNYIICLQGIFPTRN